jgi:hypothetical protein
MAAAVYDLYIEQGTTYKLRVKLLDANGAVIPLTGYTARMQIRQSIASPTFLVELTNANAGITINAAGGYLDLKITDTATKALTFTSPAVYDIELIGPTPGFEVTRLLKGLVTLDPEVTR